MSESAPTAQPTPSSSADGPAQARANPIPGPPQSADSRGEKELQRALAAARDLPDLDESSATPDQMQRRIDVLTEAHDRLRAQLSALDR